MRERDGSERRKRGGWGPRLTVRGINVDEFDRGRGVFGETVRIELLEHYAIVWVAEAVEEVGFPVVRGVEPAIRIDSCAIAWRARDGLCAGGSEGGFWGRGGGDADAAFVVVGGQAGCVVHYITASWL